MSDDLISRIVSDTSLVGLIVVCMLVFRTRINALLEARRRESEEARELLVLLRASVEEWRTHVVRIEAIATEGVGYMRRYATGDGDGDRAEH